MSNKKYHLNFYPWLTDADYGDYCKKFLAELYDKYYYSTNKEEKTELFKQIEVYLSVVCDIIAYRYLVKHYSNLFYRLCITVEEYMDYKVKRLLVTIKEKNEHIDDILSYIYMSFMLSSPRLIYDFGEKIGRCQLVKENLPYYQVARNKFFSNGEKKEEGAEHIIFTVDTLYLDDNNTDSNSETRSNINKYSYDTWKNKVRTEDDGENDLAFLIKKVKQIAEDYSENSGKYLIYLFENWKNGIEDDYQKTKQKFCPNSTTYSFIDYLVYKFENKEIKLTYEEYTDTLKILNSVLKLKK